jgi:hypothetical protein
MSDDASSNLFPASNIKQEQIEVEDEDEADSSRLGINLTFKLDRFTNINIV